MDTQRIQNFFKSKAFMRILYVLGGIVVALAIFQAGVFVGYRKASFSLGLGNNYYRAFGGHDRRAPFGLAPDDEFSEGHGAIGRIVRVSLPSFVVATPDNLEKTVVITGDTAIRRFRDAATPNDLKVDQYVVVLGSPNSQSQIEAKLIRLLPPPPPSPGSTSQPSPAASAQQQ
jgi:hypothetical protein